MFYLEADFDDAGEHRDLGELDGAENLDLLRKQLLDVAHQVVVHVAIGNRKTKEFKQPINGFRMPILSHAHFKHCLQFSNARVSFEGENPLLAF